MANGHRGARQQQFEHLRAADNIRCAHHHRFFALHIHAVGFQERHHAFGRAGAHQRHFYHQTADVVRVEAVHIFVRQNALEHGLAVDLLGQWQLHQNAVHFRVGI